MRTLFRLWIVGTVIWVAICLAALWSDPDIKTLFVKAAFIPPAIIFVIGIMLAWAFGRFPRR